MKEQPPTWTPVELGQARYVRALRGDAEEQLGVYLVVGFKPEGEGEAAWRVLNLVPYHWAEEPGDVVEHCEQWMQEWTEPLK